MTLLLLAASLLLCQSQTPGGALGGRPLSWDTLGAFPLNYERKLTKEDWEEIRSLREGETSQVLSDSLQRLRKSKDDLVAGWLFVQAAKIKNSTDEALRQLDAFSTAGGEGTDYARIKCLVIKLLGVMATPNVDSGRAVSKFFDQVQSQAKQIWLAHPDCLELIAPCMGIVDLDEGRVIMAAYVNRHPKDFVGRTLLARLYVEGYPGVYYDQNGVRRETKPDEGFPRSPKPDLAKPILDELLKEQPHNPSVQYYLGFYYVKKKMIKQALAVYTALAGNDDAPVPIQIRAKRFVGDPAERSLHMLATE